jgi:hypothetical protein
VPPLTVKPSYGTIFLTILIDYENNQDESSNYEVATRLDIRLDLATLHVRHCGVRRTLLQPCAQGVELRAFAAGIYLDATVGEVVHPAVQAELQSLAPCRSAVEHALYPARY